MRSRAWRYLWNPSRLERAIRRPGILIGGSATVQKRAMGYRFRQIARSKLKMRPDYGRDGPARKLVARVLHDSFRRARPFRSWRLNWAVLRFVAGGRVFGHERGAFTSATARRDGLIAHAEVGTLFLDEVDSLSTRRRSICCVCPSE